MDQLGLAAGTAPRPAAGALAPSGLGDAGTTVVAPPPSSTGAVLAGMLFGGIIGATVSYIVFAPKSYERATLRAEHRRLYGDT